MTYMVNEIFYSLQGEGRFSGTPNVFVRFSGCNLKCLEETHGFDCDTEFVSGRKLTLEEIIQEINECVDNSACKRVILTGGEPALQVDRALVTKLHSVGYQVAIETNGTVDVTGLGLDWVTLSPKVAEHALKQQMAHEVKYVRGYGQGLPKTRVEALYYFISPATVGNQVDHRTLGWCIDLVLKNTTPTKWALSLQQHKVWAVR